MQGVTPAMMAREVLILKTSLKPSALITGLILSISLAVSALYELFEAAFAIITQIPAEVVMAWQGDLFDTHWDMMMALLGSMFARYVLGHWHENQILKKSKEKRSCEQDLDRF